MKKLASILLVLVLALALSTAAFAAPADDLMAVVNGDVNLSQYAGQVEQYIAAYGAENITADQVATFSSYVEHARSIADAVGGDYTKMTPQQIQSIKDDAVAAAALFEGVSVDFSAVKTGRVTASINDKVITAELSVAADGGNGGVIKPTGFNGDTTLFAVAALVVMALLGASVVITRKMRLLAE